MSDKFTWMHSGQIGAPQMNGASGSNGQMLQVLDGVLINGFNPQTVTIATKTATTVTLTFGVSHGYELLQIITVSGATDAALNGQHRVISKTATTVTIDAVGVAVTTGTITTKVAPLGWESIFGSTDTLKRAYRSQNIESSQSVLYLDMNLPAGHGYNATNPAKRAMVSVCEDMTTLGVQINSYTNAENNYAANINGKLFWYQCRGGSKNTAVNDTQNRSWVIVGNDKFFYFFNEWQTYNAFGSYYRDIYAFGDLDSLDGVVSANNCAWVGSISVNDTDAIYLASNGSQIGGATSVTNQTSGYIMKNADGSGVLSPFVFTVDGFSVPQIKYSGTDGNVLNYPNPYTQGIVGLATHILDSKSILRATMPRLLSIPQNLNNNFAALDRFVSAGTVVVSVSKGRYTPTATNGFFALNIKG